MKLTLPKKQEIETGEPSAPRYAFFEVWEGVEEAVEAYFESEVEAWEFVRRFAEAGSVLTLVEV